MEWYWIALIVSLFTPFVVNGGAMRDAFEEGGLWRVLWVWLSYWALTAPVVFLVIWLGDKFL